PPPSDAVPRYRLTLEYDGTDYHGWQLQGNVRTLQGALLDALEKLLGRRPTVYASGRTDAGVHALGQVVNFRADTRLQPDEIQRALNSLLPRDIAVRRVGRVPDDFHAQHSSVGKAYKYVILNRGFPSPLLRRFSWHVRSPLDVSGMREGGAHLVGRHDFRAFWGGDAGSERDPVRTVEALDVLPEGETIEIRIKADGFLRYMVRNIVGTLVEVGRGKMTPARVREILESRDRSQAGPTAPPQGLFLVEVFYETSWGDAP
ncbi:MAG: tRNA pseudouridine(38-40) synthase TruA, partial [Nitrospinota bacterium]